MITGDEERSERSLLQPIERVLFLGVFRCAGPIRVPNTAEVAADDHVVGLRQFPLLRKRLGIKPMHEPIDWKSAIRFASVGISRYEYGHRVTSFPATLAHNVHG